MNSTSAAPSRTQAVSPALTFTPRSLEPPEIARYAEAAGPDGDPTPPPRALLQGVRPALSGAHPHHRLDGNCPDLAVTDLARLRRLHDDVDHAVGVTVLDEHLDADLRHEVDD